MTRPTIDQLKQERANVRAQAETLARTGELRALTAAEDKQFNELVTELRDFDAAIEQQRAADHRATAGDAARLRNGQSAPAVIGYEARTYRPDGDHSYFKDLALRAVNHDAGATERLTRHAHEAAVETRALGRQPDVGAGGGFVPPAYLLENFVSLARARRPYADAVGQMPLTPGTDSINLPKVATGTTVDIQNGDNTAVSETDITDTYVTTQVVTLAGQQSVSLQLIEQSGIAFDEVIFGDLMGALATKVDLQTLVGTGANNQVLGVLNMTGKNDVTYTSASPTLPGLYSKLAKAIQLIHTSLFAPPTHIWMHPRRWAWCLSSLDSASRPLVTPTAGGPSANMGVQTTSSSDGPVGTIQGVAVYLDPSIPTNRGAGTNEDVIIVAAMGEQWLFEGSPVSRALMQTKAETLTVLLQVYEYLGFIPHRQPQSVSVISGTGLVDPAL